MTETNTVFHSILDIVIASIPFILLCFLNGFTNLKKQVRSRQFLMPAVAVVYCLLMLIFMDKITVWLSNFMIHLTEAVAELPYIGAKLAKSMRKIDWTSGYIMAYVVNVAALLFYYLLKAFATLFMSIKYAGPNNLHKSIAGHFYEYQEDLGIWTISDEYGQARQYFKYIYYTIVIFASIVFMAIQYMIGEMEILKYPFYPVVCVIIIGECYFFLDGMTKAEYFSQILGEDEASYRVTNYTVLRPILRKLFGDRELGESVGTNNQNIVHSNDGIVHPLLMSEDTQEQIFGVYLKDRALSGLKLNPHYVSAMKNLMKGKSVLFSNPFYNDIGDYLFYVVHHTLLKNKKILIIAGRHATEQNLEQWVREGIGEVTGMARLWEVGTLNETDQNLDIGIISRSMLYNLSMMDENRMFLNQVGLVILVEPSKLITTGQIGLSLLVKKIKASGNEDLTFCSFDHNSDGLVDALSHILMTSISEVSATSEYEGTNTRMFWDADGEYLHHRIIPNVSRYMGVGTEISAVAIRNQISKVTWYGGEAFPVVDMNWIVGQYFSAFSTYTGIGRIQEEVNEHFKVQQSLWDAKVQQNQFLVVEDELRNMFETARQFSTRAKEQGFVNIICSNYLLRDYMADNSEIFAMDAKAIPSIVADYARTERNSVLKLLMRMASKPVSEKDIRTELEFLGIKEDDVRTSLQRIIELYFPMKGEKGSSYFGANKTEPTSNVVGEEYSYELSADRRRTIVHKKYYIENPVFLEKYVTQLQNAYYVSEDEKGNLHYLGAELMGQIAQKHLPGQYFTYDGKYYEVLSFHDHNVFVRRAADHISQREYYRQERRFVFNELKTCELMGERKEIGDIKLNHYLASITVSTPSYYRMTNYNDMANAKRVIIGNIPDRHYNKKSILQLEFPGVEPEVRNTICMLLNELFYSVYPEGHEFLCAVTADGDLYELPGMTYYLDEMNADDCIYIIEDSQLDLGLLISVERYLRKFLGIIHDFLEWHMEALEQSLHPEEEESLFEPVNNIPDPEPPKGFFQRWLEKLRARRKRRRGEKADETTETPVSEAPVKEAPPEEIPAEEVSVEETAEEEVPVEEAPAEETPAEEVVEETQTEEAQTEETATEETDTEETVAEVIETEESDAVAVEKLEEETVVEDDPVEETTVEEAPVEETAEEEVPVEEVSVEETAEEEIPAEEVSVEETVEEEIPAEEVSVEETAEEEVPAEEVAVEETAEEETPTEEPAKKPGEGSVTEHMISSISNRKPYHERYYLLYGSKETSEHLKLEDAKDYLGSIGFDNSYMEQARKGKDIARQIKEKYNPELKGFHSCDFCGIELVGSEYEILADGRERCINCGKNAVTTEKEFVEIYKETLRNLEGFFGIRINVGISVKMTTADKIAKRLGEQFRATPGFDARVVGVAIKSREGYTLLLENGAPRISAVMTIAHELTHIWQYLNWNMRAIRRQYGNLELQVYEGMAKWVEIQYALLINEKEIAMREEINTRRRQDEYGYGFLRYIQKYSFSRGQYITQETPFMNPEKPL